MKLLAKLTGEYSSSAKVVDGSLILSLPDALSPVVWRMDLGKVKASALEVREGEGGVYVLVLKTPKEEINEIAPFDSRAKAVDALMAVSRAMEGAHGQIRPAAAVSAGDGNVVTMAHAAGTEYAGGKHGKGRLAATFIGIVILGGLIYALISLSPPRSASLSRASGAFAPALQTAQGDNGGSQAGVPVSADDFLMGR